ncbi:MAG: phosphotransferase family protein [Acidimicrobiia bacterium]|nr:phosphotransferase family protein [Acidimicrobiia bacterium]
MSSPAPELAVLLRDALGATEISDLRRLSGGASRETWRFAADGRELVVQRQRSGDVRDMMAEAEAVRVAHDGGVPVPRLIDARQPSSGGAYMILEAVEGETIARKILRDDRFGIARERLVADVGAAAAAIHRLAPQALPSLEEPDQLTWYTDLLDVLARPHPVLELVRRWLIEHRPTRSVGCVVHGDFRLGNLIVDEAGLAAVIDWELAHLGDPMEDLGWLCVKAWRFGGGEPVAGLGSYDDLFEAYETAGGVPVDPTAVHWWEILGTWKWAIMCIMQANAHLSGASRSHELAAIGRRVCENEYDLLQALEGRW